MNPLAGPWLPDGSRLSIVRDGLTQSPLRKAGSPRDLSVRHQAVTLNVTSSSDTSCGSSLLTNLDTATTGSSTPYPDSTMPQDDTDINVYYLEIQPQLADQEPPVFEQERSARNFKHLSAAKRVQMSESFPGALDLVLSMNPDYWKMEYGTRVIAIKTDYPVNIVFAVQNGKWSTLEAVAERIMKVWDGRQYPSEKILFLFSINRTGQFCGLAEMTGPWNPNDHIDGWAGASESAGCVGSIPIRFIYLKNVPYAKFTHIRQPHNAATPAQMWTGMRFDMDTGRKVIEIYAKEAHVTNMLVQPKSPHSSDQLRISNREWQALADASDKNPSQHAITPCLAQRGGFASFRGRGGSYTRGHASPRVMSDNWRAHSNTTQSESSGLPGSPSHMEDASSSIAHQHIKGTHSYIAPPRSDTMPEHLPGTLYVADESGQLVPVSGPPPVVHSPRPIREVFGNLGRQLRLITNMTGEHSFTLHHHHSATSIRGGYSPSARDCHNASQDRYTPQTPQYQIYASPEHRSIHHASSASTLRFPAQHTTPDLAALQPPQYDQFAGFARHNLRHTSSTSSNWPLGQGTSVGGHVATPLRQAHSAADLALSIQRNRHVASAVHVSSHGRTYFGPSPSSGKMEQISSPLPFVQSSETANSGRQSARITYTSDVMKAMNTMTADNVAKDDQFLMDNAIYKSPSIMKSLTSTVPSLLSISSSRSQGTYVPPQMRELVHSPSTAHGTGMFKNTIAYPLPMGEYPVPDNLDLHPIYYGLMADKVEIEKTIRETSFTDDMATYYRCMGRKAQIEGMLKNLVLERRTGSESSEYEGHRSDILPSIAHSYRSDFNQSPTRTSNSSIRPSEASRNRVVRKPVRISAGPRRPGSKHSWGSAERHDAQVHVGSPRHSEHGEFLNEDSQEAEFQTFVGNTPDDSRSQSSGGGGVRLPPGI